MAHRMNDQAMIDASFVQCYFMSLKSYPKIVIIVTA